MSVGSYGAPCFLFHLVVQSNEVNFLPAYYYMGLSYEQLGRLDDSIHCLEHARSISPAGLMWVSSLGHAYGAAGRADQAREVLATLKARSEKEYVGAFSFAIVHLGLGEMDEALSYFERAFEERSPRLTTIFTDGRFRTIRQDERFAALEAKHGLRLDVPQLA